MSLVTHRWLSFVFDFCFFFHSVFNFVGDVSKHNQQNEVCCGISISIFLESA